MVNARRKRKIGKKTENIPTGEMILLGKRAALVIARNPMEKDPFFRGRNEKKKNYMKKELLSG